MNTHEFHKPVRRGSGFGALWLAVLFAAGTASAAFDPLQGQVHRGNLQRTGLFTATGVTQQASLKWKFKTGGAVYSSPVVVSNIMYVGSFDGKIYALDAQSGAQRWVVTTGDKVAGSAAVANGVVYIMTEAGYLLALNAQTGSNIWSYATGQKSCNSPAVISNVVYTMTGDPDAHEQIGMSSPSQLVAINAATGSNIWSVSVGANGMAAVATDGQYLYAGMDNWQSYFSITNGARLFDIDMGHQARLFAGTVVGSNGWWYAPATMRGSIKGMQASTTKWTAATLATNLAFELYSGGLFGYEIIGDPALAGGLILAGCNDGALHTFNATNGVTNWMFQTSDKIQTAPSVANGRVYFGGWNGNFYCVSLTNGAQQWSYNLGSNINSSAWVADNTVYVGCDDGAVYCLQDAAADFSILIQSNNVAVPEAGTNSFNIRLSSAPVASTTVSVSFASGYTGISLTGTTNFVFTTSTWSNWQGAVLSCAQNTNSFAGETLFACSASGLAAQTLRTVELDNEQGIMVSTTHIVVREGTTSNMNVRLMSAPATPTTVTVAKVSGDTDLTVQSGTQLVFTASNWSTPQTVGIKAALDADMVNGTALFRCSASGQPSADITATELDIDAQNIIVSSSALTILEGSSNSVLVSLSVLPTQAVTTVTVAWVSGDPDISVQSGSTLVYTTNNWDTAQTVWIGAAVDPDALNGQAIIRLSSPGVANQEVVVTERDTDAFALPPGTIVTIDNASVIASGVKRMGINLTGDSGTGYESPLMKKSTEHNFEGTSYRQAHDGHLFNDAFAMPRVSSHMLETYGAGWSNVYIGAAYTLLSGPAKGATGTVVAVSNRVYVFAGAITTNLVLVFSNPLALTNSLPLDNTGLLVEKFNLDEGTIYWSADSSYWTTLNCSIWTNDVPSNSFGRCALWMDGSASAAVKRVTSTYQVWCDNNGTWTLQFWGKSKNGTPTLKIAADSNYGPSTNVTLTTSWQKFTLSLAVTNVPEMLSLTNTTRTLTYTLTVTNGGALIDDVEFWKNGDINSTAFKDQVVNTLKKLHPGILRRLQMGGNTVSNAIMPRIKAHSYMSNPWASTGPRGGAEENPFGMHEFFQLCEEVGAEPWYNLPGTLHQDEMDIFMEYIGGSTNTTWGKVRADLGHPQPWTQVFTNIHVEIGNEAWNTFGPFEVAGFKGPDYWQDLFAKGRASVYYSSKVLFHAAGMAASGSSSATILGDVTNADRFAIAPYMLHELHMADLDQNPAEADLFRWHFGTPYYVIYTNRLNGHVDNCTAAGVELSIYEVNHHVTGGDVTNTDSRTKLSNTMGAGVNMANTMLSMLKLYNIRSQAFFDFLQYDYITDVPVGTNTVKAGTRLWGSYINLRPGMERTRPTGLMLEMINSAIGPEMLSSTEGGDLYTATGVGRYDSTRSSFTPMEVSYPTIQSFAFRDGNRRGLILLNLDTESNRTVFLNLSERALNNSASTLLLTSDSITNNNDYEQSAPQVAISSNTVSGFTNGMPISMPPFSIRTLTWLTNGTLQRVLVSSDQVNVPEGGTAQFQICLDSQPATDLTVNVAWAGGDTDIWVQGASAHLFTPDNWSAWQPVTLVADPDPDVVNGTATIRCETADGVATDVKAIEQDSDFKALISKSALTMNENATNSFQIKLAGMPEVETTVTVARVSGDPSLYFVSGTDLVFNSDTWSNWQTVVVGAAHDPDLLDGVAIVQCALNEVNFTNVTVTILDDDPIRLTVAADTYVIENKTTNLSASTNLIANQASGAPAVREKTYIRFLTTNLPANLVDARLTLTMSGAATNTVQSHNFLLYGLNNGDAMESWNQTTINWTNAPAYTNGGNYSWASVDLARATLIGTVSDNVGSADAGKPFTFADSSTNSLENFLKADTNGMVTFIVVQTNESSIREMYFASKENPNYPGPQLVVYYEPTNTVQVSTSSLIVPEGTTNSFQIRLGVQPYSSVTVETARVSGDTDLSVVSGASLVFASTNWNQWKTVTLSAAVDADVFNGQALFRCSIPGGASNDVTVTELDSSFISFITNTGTVQVVEGQTNQFLFKLSAAPTSAVTATISHYAGSTNIQVIGTTQLVFTAGNWDTWATGKIYSVHDADLLHDTATVVCAASGGIPGPSYVSVTQFDVDARHITLSTNALAFTCLLGYPSPISSFSVVNTGGGTMDYSVATNVGWLTVTPSSVSGLDSGTPQVHVLSVRTNGLVPGVSNATITVTASQADNTPQTIAVTMTVDHAPIPALSVTPTNLNFVWNSPATTATNLAVNFEGMARGTNLPPGWTQQKYGNVNWDIRKGGRANGPYTNAYSGSNNACLYDTLDTTNLLITPAINFGSATSAVVTFWHLQAVRSGQQDQLTIQYRTNTSALWVAITNYTSSITTWTKRSLNLPVITTNYQIAFKGWATGGNGVCLDDVAVVSYGAVGSGVGSGPVPQTLTVSNSGYGYLQVSNVWTVPWLNVQPGSASGLASGQSAQFTVSVLTNTISRGTNTATLTLASDTAPNAPVLVPVTLTVPTNLTFRQLTVASASPQWGTANPPSGFYLSGLPVRLIALASNYCHFVQWTGGVQGVSAVTDIVLNASMTTTAVFAETILINNTPAWWLGQYNLPADDSGALADFDGDGLAAWQEYLAGTVPTNAGSVFNMTGLSVSSSTVVRWSTVSGRVYSVYWTSNLLNGFTTVLGTNIPWSQPVFTDTVYGVQNQGFYQIKVNLAP